MKRSRVVAVALASLVALVLPVSAGEGDVLEKLLESPPATGLLVTRVGAKSQAESVGVEPGDILTRYAGRPTPTLDDLRAAVGAAIGATSVEIVLVKPDGIEVRHTIAPGKIGIDLTPVKKGEPVGPLPPKTNVQFDYRRLEKSPHDDWYAFQLSGTLGKNGFEHAMVGLQPDGEGGRKLVMHREVAFDGGEKWGVNHMDVRQEATATSPPRLLRWTFENPITGFDAEGRVEGGKIHFSRKTGTDTSEGGSHDLPADLPAIPTYLVETLACCMPQAAGACFHYRPIQDGSGEVGRPTALLAAEAEEIEIDGAKHTTFRYEVHQLGGAVVSRFWVDPRGHVVKSDYGGAVTTRSTKEAALKGLHADIKPRTAN